MEDPIPSTEDFDCLPIPPLDPLFFSTTTRANPSSSSSSFSDPADNTQQNFVPDLCLDFDDNYDIDITLDDIDLYFPSENEQFLIPDGLDPPVQPNPTDVFNQSGPDSLGRFGAPDLVNSGSPELGSSGVCCDHGSDVDKYLNCSPSEAGSCDSGDRSSGSARATNFPSPVSSHVSGNNGSSGGPGVFEGLNAGSPNSGNFVVDQNVKIEEGKTKNGNVPKRKKEAAGDDANCGGETRNQKSRRSENTNPNTNLDANNSSVSFGGGGLNEEEEKRRARLMRNRESAQLSRQRKKHYVEELEDKVRTMHSTIAELNGKISYFMAENTSLRQQLSGGGPQPPPGMYPAMAPVAYPWVPCAPYVVKPQGSQVPLVPIPRLKPQQPVSTGKAKKVENKKSEGKTKKVASVSFLGLLFFILLFGWLVPIVDIKFGGVRDNGINGLNFVSQKFYDQHKGRVLIVDGHSNGSHENVGVGVGFSNGKSDIGNRIHCDRGRNGCSKYDVVKKGGLEHLPNASEPLVASLFVPRNDKLVKIDGNLIIHSVLASERAMASSETTEVNNTKETGLAIPRDLSPSLAIHDVGSNRGRHSHLYQNPTEQQRALSSGSAGSLKDHLKSLPTGGKLQQWFREGLAGPMLSSGMCTEVFQFDTSPAPGAIVPASSVANITAEHKRNATDLRRGKNRRTLHGLPIRLTGSDLNITGEHVGRNSQKDKFQGNKSVSSMVVSVLVDPREAGDSDIDGVITPKSLSRIFVVVLLDSLKEGSSFDGR